ncbi:MAG: AAA family ATPase [Alphaproteobacteria bacterium]|nr:AAA family ATPase [Alphaproteobacteria bacterium]
MGETPSWETARAALDALSDGTPAIQTHANRIVFAGDVVYKLKRPVTLPFLDYGTPEIRRDLVEREIAYNRVTAPALYLGRSVVTDDGRVIDDPDDATYAAGEPLVRMRRFPADALLDGRDSLPPGVLERLARDVAGHHRHAPRMRKGSVGGSKPLDRLVGDVVAEIRAFEAKGDVPGIEPHLVEALTDAFAREVEAVADLFDARRIGGVYRRCHGDLHLKNIALIDGVPTLFDCIEFSEGLSLIDPYYDLAFLLMDLRHRGFAAGASRVLSAYLTMAPGTKREEREVYGGLRLLPLYLALRATIRAYIDARVARETGDVEAMGAAGRYVVEAIDFLRDAPPTLLAVGGISGTGKSTLAFGLAPRRGRGAGAVVIRSDAVRKKLFGAGQTDRLPQEAYGKDWTNRTFREMRRLAGLCLDAGSAAIADAVHATAWQQRSLERVAFRRDRAFEGIWLEIDVELAVARAEARRRDRHLGDVSDAGEAVVRRMAAGLHPPDFRWRRIDAGRSPEAVLDDAAHGQDEAHRHGGDDQHDQGAGQKD